MLNDSSLLKFCKILSKESRCLSRQIGAVLTNNENHIIGTGYNNPPDCLGICDLRYYNDPLLINELKLNNIDPKKLIDSKICPRKTLKIPSGERLNICPAVHAERNCILDAAYKGISTKNSKLYMDECIPCSHCLIEMINAGVKEIIVSSLDYYDKQSKYIFNSSDMIIRLFNSQIKYNILI